MNNEKFVKFLLLIGTLIYDTFSHFWHNKTTQPVYATDNLLYVISCITKKKKTRILKIIQRARTRLPITPFN